MKQECGCGFPGIRIFEEQKDYACSDLRSLEAPVQIWPGSQWKSYDESLRINAYVALHEAFRKNSSALFLPDAIKSSYKEKIFCAIKNNSDSLPPGCLAFVTSGSTGVPKIVIHRKETLILAAKKIIERYPEINKLKFHNTFPGNYMAGILNNGVLPWLTQSEVYLDSEFTFKSPFDIAKKSQKSGTNFAWLSPSMISSLNSAIKSDPTRKPAWDLVLSATGPLSHAQAKAFKEHGIELQNTFGSTELLFISGTRDIKDDISCGSELDGVKIEIRNETTEDEIEIGEVWVKSNTIPVLEMIEHPASGTYVTVEPSMGGYRNTQDRGYLHQEKLYLVARSDDIIVLGGINVSLARLENFADRYPGVIGSCASARYGGSYSDLVIYYEAANESNFEEAHFQQYIEDEFGALESPRKYVQMKLPRTHHGKIDKTKLRKGLK